VATYEVEYSLVIKSHIFKQRVRLTIIFLSYHPSRPWVIFSKFRVYTYVLQESPSSDSSVAAGPPDRPQITWNV
jgi:hypothetical protein